MNLFLFSMVSSIFENSLNFPEMNFFLKNTFYNLLFLFFLFTYASPWQQRVNYKIEVSLDTKTHSLTGRETLKYFNLSPDTLSFVWFHLYPNAYKDNQTTFAKEELRDQHYRFFFAPPKDRGFIEIKSLRLIPPLQGREPHPLPLTPPFLPSPSPQMRDPALAGQGEGYRERLDTEMKVNLPSPLAPADSVIFEIEFFVKIPKIFSRLGYVDKHYEISQWYPKIVVYDEKGWHPDGYHNIGEFYGDFGTFDVELTLPKEMVVGATGILTDSIISSDSLTKTLSFQAENVHDFAWVADEKYKEVTETFDSTTIRVLFLPENEKKWKEVMQYAKDALYYYGKWYGEYPYKTLTICDGSLAAGGGMEYPNLVIISTPESKFIRNLERVVIHEIGHQWFYGILANNEMDEAWLDEGMNSFSENRYFEEKYGTKGNLLKSKFLKRIFSSFNDRYQQEFLYHIFAKREMDELILKKSCTYNEPASYALSAYAKPALMMVMLCQLVGQAKFDTIMQTYFRDYKFKHVNTEDFIDLAQRISGQKLDWFFEQWLKSNKNCDYALTSVRQKKVSGKTGIFYPTSIMIEQKGEIVMPFDLLLKMENRDSIIQRIIPQGKFIAFGTTTKARLASAEIDPQKTLLETNRWNNYWPRRVSIKPVFDLPSLDAYQIFWCPYPWYDEINGLRIGAWFQGREFFDAGPILGRHQWMLTAQYGAKSKKGMGSLSYQTPLLEGEKPVRMFFSANYGFGQAGLSLTLWKEGGPFLFKTPHYQFGLKFSYQEVQNFDFLEPRDWSEGKYTFLEMNYLKNTSGERFGQILKFEGRFSRKFWRVSVESQGTLRFTRYFSLLMRGFSGIGVGTFPFQEEFFLSGALRRSGLAALIAADRGSFSPQEHYRLAGDGNLRGYYGQHLHGKNIATINFEVPLPLTPLIAFYDLGSLWSEWFEKVETPHAVPLQADAGVGLHLGPLIADFPFWVSSPKSKEKCWKLRWTVGFGGSIKF